MHSCAVRLQGRSWKNDVGYASNWCLQMGSLVSYHEILHKDMIKTIVITQHLHEPMERRLPTPFEVMMLVLVTFTATSFSNSLPAYIIYSFRESMLSRRDCYFARKAIGRACSASQDLICSFFVHSPWFIFSLNLIPRIIAIRDVELS